MGLYRLIDYKDFGASVRKGIQGRRTPVSGALELTWRCNMRCAQCYNNLPASHPSRLRELTFEEYRRLLDEVAEMGCFWLLLTGGEVFVRPDFLQIYDHAKQNGFLITIFTNATAITEEAVDHLAGLPPFRVEVSLYGATKETYETVTRTPGSFERCLAGIGRLLDRSISLVLKTVLTTTNHHELPRMKELAAGLGVKFRYDGTLNARFDCSLDPVSLRLPPERLVAFDLADQARVDALRQSYARFQSLSLSPGQQTAEYWCGAGINGFSVDPFGGLRLCLLSRADGYDLRAGVFQDGWEDFLGCVRARRLTHENRCSGCALRPLCDTCPAHSALECGRTGQPSPFLCELGHLRALVLGLPVPPHGDCDFCPGGSRYDRLVQRASTLQGSTEWPEAHIRELRAEPGSSCRQRQVGEDINYEKSVEL